MHIFGERLNPKHLLNSTRAGDSKRVSPTTSLNEIIPRGETINADGSVSILHLSKDRGGTRQIPAKDPVERKNGFVIGPASEETAGPFPPIRICAAR